MSMGDKPTPPAPMDPTAVANTQQGYNIDAAKTSLAANAIDQTTPFGSLEYKQTGVGPNGIPIYSATQKLTPEQQGILNALQGQATNLLTNANYGGSNPADVVGSTTSGITADLLKKNVAQIQPYMDTARDQLDTKLRNQGFAPGQPGYDNAMRGLLDSQNRTIQGFEASIQPQAYQQATSSYLLPLTMSASSIGLMNPNAVKQGLTTTPVTNIQPANYMAAVGQYQDMLEKQYQQQMDQYSNSMSGMFGIPTAILGGWAQNGGVQALGKGLSSALPALASFI